MDGKRASVAASTLGHGAQWQELFRSGPRRALRYLLAHGALPLVPPQNDAQDFMQLPMRAEKPQPHRHRGNSEPVGNFLGGVLQNVAQQADLPQIGSKLRDRASQQRAHLAPRESFFGIFSTSRDTFGEVVPGFAAVFFQGNEDGI